MSAMAAGGLDDALLNSLVNAILNESKLSAGSSPVELSKICEKLAEEVGGSLAGIVPSVDPAVLGTQACKLSEFTNAEYPSMFVLARRDEASDIVLFRFSAKALDWWVSSSLGGSPARKDGDLRPVTPIEVRVGRIAIDLTLGALVRVLSGFGLDLAIHECRTCALAEDLPKFPYDPAGYAVSIGLAPNVEGLTINFFVSEALAVEWSRIASAPDEAESVTQANAGDKSWPEELENQFSIVSVSIDAVLTTELIELDELMSWAPGRVIALRATTETPLRFMSNDLPLFTGQLGQIDDQLCVQVIESVDPTEAEFDNMLGAV